MRLGLSLAITAALHFMGGGTKAAVIGDPVLTGHSDGTVTMEWESNLPCHSIIEIFDDVGRTSLVATVSQQSEHKINHEELVPASPDSFADGVYYYNIRLYPAEGTQGLYQGSFEIDATAPVLSSAQVGTPTTDGTAGAGVTTDTDEGTLYWAVVTNGGSCTTAQLKAGSGGNIVSGKAGNAAITSAGAKTIPTITGLSAGTNYQIKFLHTDAEGNDSSQASANLTTVSASAEQTISLQQAWLNEVSYGTTSLAKQMTSTPAQGDMICLVVYTGEGVDRTATPSDNMDDAGGTAWVEDKTSGQGGSWRVRIFRRVVGSGNTTSNPTITVAFSNSFVCAIAFGVYRSAGGIATVWSVDGTAVGSFGNASTLTPIPGGAGDITLTSSKAMIISAFGNSVTDVQTTSPYTQRYASGFWGGSYAYVNIFSTSGAKSTSATRSGAPSSGNWAHCAVGYRADA